MEVKYTRKDYNKYIKELRANIPTAYITDYESWKELQLIGDKIMGLFNKMIKRNKEIKNLKSTIVLNK